MKFDFSVLLKDAYNEQLEVPIQMQDKKGKDLTLRIAAVEALMFLNPEKKESGKDKYRAWQLTKTAMRSGMVELSAEEVVFLKDKIGDFWSPNVVGACYDILEGVTQPPMLKAVEIVDDPA